LVVAVVTCISAVIIAQKSGGCLSMHQRGQGEGQK
jgi:hypothetical protein